MWTYGSVDFFWKFINFSVFPLLAYALSVADFGIYALLTVQTWLFVMLISCGLNNSLERFYMEREDCSVFRGSLFFSGSIVLCCLSFLLLGPSLVLLYIYRDFFSTWTQIPWALSALAVINAFPMALFQFICNVFRLDFSPFKYGALVFLQNAIALGLSLYFIFIRAWGVEGLLLGSLFSFCIAIPLTLLCVQKRISFDGKLAKRMLLFGVPFMFTDLARWIYGWMDRWLLDALSTTEEVGLFSMAFKLATVLIFFMSAFGLAWTPRALKAHLEEPEHRASFASCLTFWYVLLTLGALAMSFFGIECLMLLTPTAYWPAAFLLPGITAGLALLGTTQVTGIAIFITNKTEHFAAIAWLGALINIAFNLLWIPFWGAQGAALAILATYSVLALYHAVLAVKLYAIPLEIEKLSAITLLLGVGCSAAFYFNTLPWSWDLFLIKGGFFAVGIILLLLLVLSNRILKHVRNWCTFWLETAS